MQLAYPYSIPPVACPAKDMSQKLDPWRVLEFFRVEALLRSQKVIDLYKGGGTDDQFRSLYKVERGWEVLKGAHHIYLSMNDPRDREFGPMTLGPGVFDVGAMARWDPIGEGNPGFKMVSDWLQYEREDPQFLWLRLELTVPPDTIIRVLRAQLKKQHKISASFPNKPALLQDLLPLPKDSEPVTMYSKDPRKRPLIYGYQGIQTWLNYRQCYDLRVCEGRTFGNIALQVFRQRGSRAYERAETGYKRFKDLISKAERNNWPPISKPLKETF